MRKGSSARVVPRSLPCPSSVSTTPSCHASTKALYAKDPDGLEFEVSWLLPAALITPEVTEGAVLTAPLDLDREIARYGAQTRGGVGVSVPA